MKRKGLLLLCAALALTTVGCTKPDVPGSLDNIKKDVEKELNKATGSAADDVYSLSYYVAGKKDIIYTIDNEGNKVGEYHLDDYEAGFDTTGYSYQDVSIEGCFDNVIYFYSNIYTENGSEIYYYALDTTTNKATKFCDVSDEWSMDNLDYYNGKVYIDLRNYEENTQKELCYAKDKDSLTFTEETPEVGAILERAKGRVSYAKDFNSSFQRTYDNYGFIISTENVDEENGLWSFYKETLDGATVIEGMQNTTENLSGYSDKWAYLENYDNSDVLTDCIDIEKGTKRTVNRKDGTEIKLTTDGSKFYYYSRTEKKYGIYDYTVYSYDADEDTTEVLYTQISIPGTGSTNFGIDGFQIINGKIYAIGFFDNGAAWERFDKDKGVFVNLNLPITKFPVFAYGIINYQSNEQDCPYCGLDIYKEYVENFVLDAKYSEYADKINEALLPQLSPKEVEVDEEDCKEGHSEYPDSYRETVDTTVASVDIINDKYLVVEMDDYWYGGGAHGMPGMGQRIFDLTTGEELQVSDFYKGTEDQFKTLIAEKTKQNYEKSSEQYFDENAEDAYAHAYEYAVEGDVFFYADHAIYRFSPYIMGPYASGFIEIDLSYEELLGTKTLER